MAAGCGLLNDYGWVFPTAYPLPSGAVRVAIQTIHHSPPTEDTLYVDACPLIQLDAIVIEYRSEDAEQPVRYRMAGADAHLIWPEGFSARLNPSLEIVAPDGVVVAVEGVPTPRWYGGGMAGGTFVCIPGNPPRRSTPAP